MRLLTSWARPRYVPGGEAAFVLFAVYGQFPVEVSISGTEYHTNGLPEGATLRRLVREQHGGLPFTGDSIAAILRSPKAGLFQQAQTAPECLMLQAEVPDPPTLDFLRDLVGLVMYFLDKGGVAAIDPQCLRLYDRADWHQELFSSEPVGWENHVALLVSPEPEGTRWYHTRGLRKFGRPDLSFPGVAREHEKAVVELLQRLIREQAEGARILDGEHIAWFRSGDIVQCRRVDSTEDPAFNNQHLELSRVAS